MSEPTFDERTGQDETPASDNPPAIVPEPVMPDFDYYVHLADGQVVKTLEAPSGSRWTENGQDIQIIGVYPR